MGKLPKWLTELLLLAYESVHKHMNEKSAVILIGVILIMAGRCILLAFSGNDPAPVDRVSVENPISSLEKISMVATFPGEV